MIDSRFRFWAETDNYCFFSFIGKTILSYSMLFDDVCQNDSTSFVFGKHLHVSICIKTHF